MEEAEDKSCWVTVTEWGEWAESHSMAVSTALFGVFAIFLYATMNLCEPCVVGVLIISLMLCCQFRIMNILLWAAIIVLWVHCWRLNGGHGLTLSWN